MSRRQAKHYKLYGNYKSINNKRYFWINQPNAIKKKDIFNLKQKIKSDTQGLGIFATNHVIYGTEEWKKEEVALNQKIPPSSWVDFCFFDKQERPQIIFNAVIDTLALGIFFEIQRQITEKLESLLSKEDSEALKNEPFSFQHKNKCRKILSSLGNKTWYEANKDEFVKILNQPDHWPNIIPHIKLDKTYRYGVGAHFFVDAESISVEEITKAINIFRENDCKECQLPMNNSPENKEKLQKQVKDLINKEMFSLSIMIAHELGIDKTSKDWPKLEDFII